MLSILHKNKERLVFSGFIQENQTLLELTDRYVA